MGDWLRHELQDKQLIFHNAPFDVGMLLWDNVDVRQFNTIHDTMYGAILHDPNDYYSLDHCAQRYVGPEHKKVDLASKEDMHMVPADVIGPYAEQDVRLTGWLHEKIQPALAKKRLQDIYRLECDCISATTEMTFNGMKIDESKLAQYIDQVGKKLKGLERLIGSVNPGSGKQMEAHFKKEGIPIAYNYVCKPCSERGKKKVAWPAFKQQFCNRCDKPMEITSPHFGKKLMSTLDHPFIKAVVDVKNYSRLYNAFLMPWSRQIVDGVLPFQLNQLRDRDFGGSTKGTVTGRFSCEMWEEGNQMQQVWSVKNQIEQLGPDFILRDLFVSGTDGAVLGAVDASQIEYRLLSHFSRSNKLANEYIKNPWVDYHAMVQLKVLMGQVSRKQAKNLNFGKIYGMGRALFARQMGLDTDEADRLYDLYESLLPEAKETSQWWERQARLQGEIRTIRGRLFEFGRGDATHVAMSRLIQGSAGDLMKEALVKLWENKIFEKLRLTVHDEAIGDLDPSKSKQLVELLDDIKGVRVPIKWQLSMSNTWAMTGPETVKNPTDAYIEGFQASFLREYSEQTELQSA
jgi:DNA polymerase I-like protein with 3'-5' exonuclease and polymerase domains